MSSEAILDSIRSVEYLFHNGVRREEYLLEVIGDLCRELGRSGHWDDVQRGRAEINRRREDFIHNGDLDSRWEDEVIEELKKESGKFEDKKRALLDQYHAEKGRHDETTATHKEEVRKNKEKTKQINSLESKKSALEKASYGQASKTQTTGNANQAQTRKIAFSGLPFDVNEAQIKEYFGKSVGSVKQVTLVYGRSGHSRGIGDIVFSKPGAAAKAVKELDGMLVDKRPMKLELVVNSQVMGVPDPSLNNSSERNRIIDLEAQVEKLQKIATSGDDKIKELRGLRFSKDEQIMKLKQDLENMLSKTTELESQQNNKINELNLEIKHIETCRPSIESTCRILQMAYREFQIGKPSIEQELLEQQAAAARLDSQDAATRDLTNKLQDQKAVTCLLEWEVQDLKNKAKEMEAQLCEQAGELEEKDEQMKMLFEKVTERMYKLKSGSVLEKGRRLSF